MLQFAGDHPLVFLAALWIVCWLAVTLGYRIMRVVNIQKHGWPPPHCDADGDMVSTSDRDNA